MPPNLAEANLLTKQIKMIDNNIKNQLNILTKGFNNLNEILNNMIEINLNKSEVNHLKKLKLWKTNYAIIFLRKNLIF